MMKRFLLAVLLISFTCFAQDSSTTQPQQEAAPQVPPSSDVGKSSDAPPAAHSGGGVYHVGGGVSAPKVISSPDPEYPEEARRQGIEGAVRLWLIVDDQGRPREIKVAKQVGYGFDQEAVRAVREWRFKPAMKDGKPVAVQINVEVNFRLYHRR
jgi:TonB family protein